MGPGTRRDIKKTPETGRRLALSARGWPCLGFSFLPPWASRERGWVWSCTGAEEVQLAGESIIRAELVLCATNCYPSIHSSSFVILSSPFRPRTVSVD
ncbi:hypothetical protein L249_2601 [Ophiocordyceps polyrhachis-furcata BCC 54312]|uniref:Uncharacterized protein n=1 Tax=Ophiocordyceps polyrhachis-furcata BCC 54312 TaxID=1330021 RepID=A0A367LQ76_9HYPO|nr:hypothetical protein L249_2601 [Ophiocordyceps polyrhachis-furcata BCC 54312]